MEFYFPCHKDKCKGLSKPQKEDKLVCRKLKNSLCFSSCGHVKSRED